MMKLSKYAFGTLVVLLILGVEIAFALPMALKGEDAKPKFGKQMSRSGLQGIYEGMSAVDRLFLIGFKNDANGVESSFVAAVPDLESKEPVYWKFDKFPQGIFELNKKITINDEDGNLFSLQDEKWIRLDVTWPANSKVVWSNGVDDLIVCHLSGLAKLDPHTGGCFSTERSWKIDAYSNSVKPKVCGDSLYVFQDIFKQGGILTVLSLKSGQELHRKRFRKTPSDLCQVKF